MCDIILCMSQQGINEKGNSKLKKKKNNNTHKTRIRIHMGDVQNHKHGI